MKISLNKQQMLIAASVFVVTFLLGFTVFGGFSKISRLSEAGNVEEQNKEYKK